MVGVGVRVGTLARTAILIRNHTHPTPHLVLDRLVLRLLAPHHIYHQLLVLLLEPRDLAQGGNVGGRGMAVGWTGIGGDGWGWASVEGTQPAQGAGYGDSAIAQWVSIRGRGRDSVRRRVRVSVRVT